MPFTDSQNKALAAKLSAKHVKTRVKDGFTLSYIEGWHTIAEANRIFGFDGWNRETLKTNCICASENNGKCSCSYSAQVRISVMAGDKTILREGCGAGSGYGKTLGEAHENALKEAETDAMKRALSTFGNPFGLALYDKEQKCVRQSRKNQNGKPSSWPVLNQDGNKVNDNKDPIDFCSSLKQLLESITDCSEFMALWKNNQEMVAKLREHLPDMKTEQGRHYGEILGTIYSARLQEFAARKSRANITVGLASNSNELGKETDGEENTESASCSNPRSTALSAPNTKPIPPHCKRIRNKEHLRFVASQSCLICGRSPSHAHHIKFAQPRAMGRKVSDEWAVPLCYIHHRALHDRGDEKAWWEQNKIDPIKEADRLWSESQK